MTTQENGHDDSVSLADLTEVADAADVEPGERVLVEVGGREIAVFNVDGSFHALANYCVHQGGPICEGQVGGGLFEDEGELVWDREDELVSCPWHGWEFEIDTGDHLTDKSYSVPSYDVVVRDGTVYVDA